MHSIAAVLLLGLRTVSAAPAIAQVISCLSSNNVPQYLPGTSEFAADIIPWNLRTTFTPQALAIPTTVPQVQAAVKCAAQNGVKVNPKSGGHSYAGHSLGGENGHLVIDMKYFDTVTVDSTSKVATVGPGTRLGNLAIALYANGKRAIAHGICPG